MEAREACQGEAAAAAAGEGETAKSKGWFRAPKISMPSVKMPSVGLPEGWSWYGARAEGAESESSKTVTAAEDEDLYLFDPRYVKIVTEQGETAVSIYNEAALAGDLGTVVIVHGCGGKRTQFDEGQMAQRLAAGRRVITFDLYGHGDSCSCDVFTKDIFVGQLHQVVQQLVPAGLGTGTFDLYGFSMGCFIVSHFCQQYPERVRKLVLHSPWNGETSVFAPGLKNAARVPVVGIATIAGIRKMAFPHCHDASTLKKIILMLGEGPEAWGELLKELATSNHPTSVLIICGEAEKPFLNVARGIHDVLAPKSEMLTFAGARHMSWCFDWHKPVGFFFRDNISKFIESCPDSQPSATSSQDQKRMCKKENISIE